MTRAPLASLLCEHGEPGLPSGPQEEAGGAAEKGHLGQHPAQNMPPGPASSRQVGYLAAVLGVVGNHGSGIGFLLIKGEITLAIHTVEINTATKMRCL